MVAVALAALAATAIAHADPIPIVTPDVPPRSGVPVANPSSGFRESSDLDGFYLWLGPSGAATETGGNWDTAFGGDLAALRVREHEAIGALGGDLGFSKFTAHDGGRVWLDGVVGTRAGGHVMAGATVGPILEVSDLEHPRAGASVGAWIFLGATIYARAGEVAQSGTFVEMGVRIVLPVLRR